LPEKAQTCLNCLEKKMNHENQKRGKRFQRDRSVKFKLTGRDHDIIKWVYRHRFLSSEHLISIVGGSPQGILRRLNLLYHTGYLDRPQKQRIIFGNNHCLVYGLGNMGARLIASEYDMPVEAVDWSRKNRETKEIFLEHTLMVSKILTVFRLACRGRKDMEFIEPERLVRRRQKPPTIRTHSLSWKVKIKRGEYGQKRKLSFNIIPDSVFGLRMRQKKRMVETYFFLEADRSTMPIKRMNFYRSSFYKKMTGYVASYRNGLFSEYFGFKKVRILTVTKSDERIKNMVKVSKDLHHSGNGYGLFLFTVDENIEIHNPERVFDQIWISGQGRKSSLNAV